MPTPSRSDHPRSPSDKFLSHIGGLCAAADIDLDAVTPEARTAIRAGSLTAKDIAELRLALQAFRSMGHSHCRLGVIAGKLAPLPLA